MAYTAFINNGQVEKNPDFEITQNNVVSVVANGKLTLLSTDGLGFSKAQITDANQKTTDVPIVNNQVTFTTPGVFTFTVVSGQYAYTCIVVVGEQPKQNIDNQVSKTYVIVDIIIEDDYEPEPTPPISPEPSPCPNPPCDEEPPICPAGVKGCNELPRPPPPTPPEGGNGDTEEDPEDGSDDRYLMMKHRMMKMVTIIQTKMQVQMKEEKEEKTLEETPSLIRH